MRELSMQELFKIIPLDDDMRQKLLTEYESYSDARKTEVIHITFKAFHQMLQTMKDAKYQDFMAEVTEGKRDLAPDLMGLVDDAVWEDIEGMLVGKPQEEKDLDKIRNQLQALSSATSNSH